MNFNIVEFLKKVVSIGASDIHLHTGEHPVIRRDGKIIKIDMPAFSQEDIIEILEKIKPTILQIDYGKFQDLDFAYEINDVSRFRVNVSRQLDKIAIALRTIPYEIRTIKELFLPEQVLSFTSNNSGLVLVTGPTGAGKSTTIAAIIDYINVTQAKHIITIEDPIEYIFTNKKSIISQRQLFVDTPDFASALRYSLRQDPDIIFIGEIRDTETMLSALKAAETGHLVFATVHTNNAIQTVNRIINMYTPVSDRPYIRSQLAEVLRGTISQRLIPLANGNGRKPACEIMAATPTVKDLIEKDKLEQVYDLVKQGSFDNMITLNLSLFAMLKSGEITEEEALFASSNKNELRQMMRGVYTGTGIERNE